MRKILFFICLALVCLSCTACIDNFAIQKLNQIGKEYLDKGDYDNAIMRFQSSVDLDENVFESRYNLGVAYVNKEEYANALPQLERAIELMPDSPDAVYSYAVALEGDAFAFENAQNNQETFSYDEENADYDIETTYSQEQIQSFLTQAVNAVKMYEKYISMQKDSKDIDQITGHIYEIKKQIVNYADQYQIDTSVFDIELPQSEPLTE